MLFALIAVAFVLALLGVPDWLFGFVISLFVSAISGAIVSFLVTALVEALTGDALKRVMITVEVEGYEFSISLFVLATVALRIWLFR